MHEPGLGENYFFHQTPIKTSSRKGPLRDSCTRVLLPALSGTYQLPFAAMFAAGQPKCRYPPKKNLRRSRTRLAASRWELAGRTRITVRAGFGVFVLIPVVPNSFRDDVFFGGGKHPARRAAPGLWVGAVCACYKACAPTGARPRHGQLTKLQFITSAIQSPKAMNSPVLQHVRPGARPLRGRVRCKSNWHQCVARFSIFNILKYSSAPPPPLRLLRLCVKSINPRKSGTIR